MQYMEEHTFIQEELTFSEVDKLQRMALDATMGLICLRHFDFKEEYLDEVGKGLEFCQRFREGYKLAKETTFDSTSDLSLWQAFQRIGREARARKITLDKLVDKVSMLEKNLSLIVESKGSVDEKKLHTNQRLLLDVVKVLR